MKVLVLGSGAREHALVRSLSADPAVDAVIAAPGNPGIAALALCRDIEGGPTSPKGVVALATELGVDLVVVGPEAPLVAGVTDALVAEGIACFGPTAEAARLEGSKSFAKDVMSAAEVPTGLGGTVVALQGAGTDGRRSPHSWRWAESSPSSAAGSARDADLAVDRPARDVGAVVRAGQLDAADRGIRPMAGLLQRGPGPDHGEHPSTS